MPKSARRHSGKKNQVWRSKDGSVKKFSDLDGAHLVNILMMLRRAAWQKAQEAAPRGILLGPDAWILRKPPEWEALYQEALGRSDKALKEVVREIAGVVDIDETKLRKKVAHLRRDALDLSFLNYDHI